MNSISQEEVIINKAELLTQNIVGAIRYIKVSWLPYQIEETRKLVVEINREVKQLDNIIIDHYKSGNVVTSISWTIHEISNKSLIIVDKAIRREDNCEEILISQLSCMGTLIASIRNLIKK